jgi:hypothetical protein
MSPRMKAAFLSAARSISWATASAAAAKLIDNWADSGSAVAAVITARRDSVFGAPRAAETPRYLS